ADFEIVQTAGWYRIPQKHAPKGLHAEYVAFYFGRRFGPEKWAIHYFAPQVGHELTTRLALFPDQPDHPRAQEMYYKVQLGPLQKLAQPIVSLRWRRITFLHTTWDRFQDATEINDLFVDGDPYVDRLYATLKESGIQAERNYTVREANGEYVLPLVVLCKNGRIDLTQTQLAQKQTNPDHHAQEIVRLVAAAGGQRDPATNRRTM
ncbi:MAG: hypothetical protein KC445_13370, partial [Anaerolineales bacterium]|nr:hypothetical protein [Anaerolineales bacterium]